MTASVPRLGGEARGVKVPSTCQSHIGDNHVHGFEAFTFAEPPAWEPLQLGNWLFAFVFVGDLFLSSPAGDHTGLHRRFSKGRNVRRVCEVKRSEGGKECLRF